MGNTEKVAPPEEEIFVQLGMSRNQLIVLGRKIMMKNLPKVVLALGLYLLPTTFLILALTFTERLEAANFLCPSGNVTCLIAAINEANGNGQENIMDVEPGVYTLAGTNNVADGPNGLPSI